MKTRVTSSVRVAAREILKGNVVAFPTRTVYGLGANAFNPTAVAKIFAAKNRPADNPLVVHVGSKKQIFDLAVNVNAKSLELIDEFFPGQLTLVLKKSDIVPSIVTGGLDTVCVRMPGLPLTNEFLKACGVPVAAPSANLSGRPSPTSWKHVLHDLNGRIPLILKGPDCSFGVESTIVSCLGRTPVLLRSGAVSLEDIERVVGHVRVPTKFKKALSPGLMYRHYAPKAKLVLVESIFDAPRTHGNWSFIGFNYCPQAEFKAKPRNVAEYARIVYDFLRESDARGIKTIYAEKPLKTGLGRALLDRLNRAASD